MSEERFDRLESQLSQVIQGMTVMQQNMTVMQQNMSAMQIRIDSIEVNLQNRIDSVEGTLIAAITGGFAYVR